MLDLNKAEKQGQHEQLDMNELDRRLRQNAKQWVPLLFPRGVISKDRKELRVGDIDTGAPPTKHGSCKINLTGEFAGCWYDFGGNLGGQPMSTILRATNLAGGELMEKARELADMPTPERKSQAVYSNGGNTEHAEHILTILNHGERSAGSLVETYLRSRGLELPDCCADLMHHPALMDWSVRQRRPAMVAVVRKPDTGEWTGGIHRTYLAEDGGDKAETEKPKMMLGPCAGGVVMLAPMTEDGVLGVAEGIETALAASKLFGVPVWAALSTSGMQKMALPPGLRRLKVYADKGEGGQKAAENLRDKALAAGIDATVLMPWSDDDFAEDLKQGLWAERDGVVEPDDIGVEIIPPPRNRDDLVAAAQALTRPADPDQLRVIIRGMAIGGVDTLDREYVFGVLKKVGVSTMAARQMLREERRQVGVVAQPIGSNQPASHRLQYWENGETKGNMYNALVSLEDDPRFKEMIGFDLFAITPALLRPIDPTVDDLNNNLGFPRAWQDNDSLRILAMLQEQGINVTLEHINQALPLVAKAIPFHPVIEWLDGLEWDGVPRLDTWLIDYCCVEDTPYARAVAARFLISAVARVFVPGVKVDCALILEGKQGLGKSTGLRLLFDPWFTDEIADLGSKDAAMQLRGVWCIELAELDALSRADVSRVKAFISRTNDRYRPPYGHGVIDVARQCVFAASVNDDQYLSDPTGGRRFWPVKCHDKIKRQGIWDNRDQLWAEAYVRYRNKENWYLTEDDLVAAATEEQADRQQQHPWLELIAEWLHNNPGTHNGVTTGEILEGALSKPREHWSNQDKANIGKCMKALEWQHCQRRRVTGGRPIWMYLPPGHP